MFLIILLLVFASKANSHLLGYQVLNPDETQMISNAIGISQRGLNFLEFDGTTSGILNSLILVWPELFNLDITFLTSRLTQIFLVAVIVFSALKITHLQTKKISHTTILITPIFLFFLFTKDPDYSHYSTELLSTSLLILSYFLIKKDSHFSTIYSSILAPFLLGLVLFAKIQFFPVSLVIFSIIISEIYFQKKEIRKIFLPLFFFLFPSFLILFCLIVTENLKDFLINNFLFAFDFISFSQSKNILYEVYSGDKIYTAASVEEGFKKHLLLNLVFHTIYIYFLMFAVVFFKIVKFGETKIIFSKDIIYISLIILSLILVILIPGKMHRHYLISLLPFIPLFLSQLIFSLKVKLKKRLDLRPFIISSLSFIFLILISSFQEKNKFYSKKFDQISFNKTNIHFDSPRIFQYLFNHKNNSKLYIWGWMPKWYVLSYMEPASRETISEKQIIKNNKKEYYKERLLQDVNKNHPNLIIDFVKENSFRYDKPEQNIKSFKRLYEFVDYNYLKLKKVNNNCPDYFLNKKDFDTLNRRIINYKIENEDKKFLKMNDFSVTEDVCEDKVNFDVKDPDLISISFNESSFLNKIMILSSKKNSETIDAEILIHFKNSDIKKESLKLELFPYWTTLNLDYNKKKVNKVQLNIQNLKKKKYGINELKFFKK